MRIASAYLVLFFGLGVLATLDPKVADHPGMSVFLFGVLGVLGAAILALLAKKRLSNEHWDIRFEIKSAHLVQGIAQTSVFVYWGGYYFGVREWTPFILYQLAFANILQFIVSILQKRSFTAGMAAFPIVLSINLFTWTLPENFWIQLLIVSGGILGKAFLLREVDGKRAHVFNPSAITLSFAAFLIVILKFEHLFQTQELVASYMLVPHFQLFIFAVGCMSHWVGRVSLISMGAVTALVTADLLLESVTGAPPMADVIHPNVFLGLTLLVTDPATSPRTRWGQFLFGSAYGLGVIVSYATLSMLGRPTYFDKILLVPLLNWVAPGFDRLWSPWRRFDALAWLRLRWIPMATYGVVFVAALPGIERKFSRDTSYRSWYKKEGSSVDQRLRPLMRQRWAEQCAEDPTLPVCVRLKPGS